MTTSSSPSNQKSSSSNSVKLRTEGDDILSPQPATKDTTPNTSESPQINTPTTFVPMSEERTQLTGKILGGTKLSRENHRAFFEALEFWAIQRKLLWIYDDKERYINKRDAGLNTDELEMGNATVMSLLMN